MILIGYLRTGRILLIRVGSHIYARRVVADTRRLCPNPASRSAHHWRSRNRRISCLARSSAVMTGYFGPCCRRSALIIVLFGDPALHILGYRYCRDRGGPRPRRARFSPSSCVMVSNCLCELTLAQRHNCRSSRYSAQTLAWRRRFRSTRAAGLQRQPARGCARPAPCWRNPLVDYESIYHYCMSHSKHL